MLTKKWSILYFLLALSDQPSAVAPDGFTDNQPLSYLGLHNLDTNRVRERANTEQSDTAMSAPHSQNGSTHSPSQGGKTGYADLLSDKSRNAQSEAEESALLRDLIFVSQGIDGKMIKFDAEAKIFSIDPDVSKE